MSKGTHLDPLVIHLISTSFPGPRTEKGRESGFCGLIRHSIVRLLITVVARY